MTSPWAATPARRRRRAAATRDCTDTTKITSCGTCDNDCTKLVAQRPDLGHHLLLGQVRLRHRPDPVRAQLLRPRQGPVERLRVRPLQEDLGDRQRLRRRRQQLRWQHRRGRRPLRHRDLRLLQDQLQHRLPQRQGASVPRPTLRRPAPPRRRSASSRGSASLASTTGTATPRMAARSSAPPPI